MPKLKKLKEADLQEGDCYLGRKEELSRFPMVDRQGERTFLPRIPVPLYAKQGVIAAGWEDPAEFECDYCANKGRIALAGPPGYFYCQCPIGKAMAKLDSPDGDPNYQGPPMKLRPGMAMLLRYNQWTTQDMRDLPDHIKQGKIAATLAAEQLIRNGACNIASIYKALSQDIPKELAKMGKQNAITKRGLVLFGPTGTGKTTLLSIIANHWQEQGRMFQVTTWKQLIQEVQATYAKDEHRSKAHIMRPLQNTKMLFLDDLGDIMRKGKETADRADIMRDLVTARYNADKPMIISTNLDYDQILKAFGPVVAKRLLETCAWVPVTGDEMPSRAT